MTLYADLPLGLLYSTAVIDPPWRYGDNLPGPGRGDGLHLMSGWGFAYKTMLTWAKPQIGMGRYLRNTTEHVLFGVRGRLPAEGPKNIPSHVLAPRGKHSRKPDEAYDVIRTISPAPRIDLFAREEREGFDVWGNEV